MSLEDALKNYVKLLLLYDSSKESDNEYELRELENEKNNAYSLYIDKYFIASDDEKANLLSFILNHLDNLDQLIKQLELTRDYLIKMIGEGYFKYKKTYIYCMRKIVNLQSEKEKYANIYEGMKNMFYTKKL